MGYCLPSRFPQFSYSLLDWNQDNIVYSHTWCFNKASIYLGLNGTNQSRERVLEEPLGTEAIKPPNHQKQSGRSTEKDQVQINTYCKNQYLFIFLGINTRRLSNITEHYFMRLFNVEWWSHLNLPLFIVVEQNMSWTVFLFCFCWSNTNELPKWSFVLTSVCEQWFLCSDLLTGVMTRKTHAP